MVLDIELIQLYRCDTFEALMQKTVSLSAACDVPLLTLTWAPAPGPDAAMVKNFVGIWDNYEVQMGPKGAALKRSLRDSMSVALKQDRANTKACQSWKLGQCKTFQIFGDAPTTYFLNEYERSLLRDFTAQDWPEFFAASICRERDRSLFLIAKTPYLVTQEMVTSMRRLLSTFASAYRFLFIKLGSPLARHAENDAATALSSREVECLQWLASGKTLSEAATILGISERTLRYHINNARDRLGVATTVQAVVAAALTYGFDPHDARRSIYASSRP